MELGKPSAVSITMAVVLTIVIGYLVYSSTKKTDSENYTKGATHNESSTNISPVANYYPLSIPGCSPFVRVDGDTVKATDKQSKDKKK